MENQYSEPADIKVYVKGKGVVANEKALITFNKDTNKIIAIGSEAPQAAKGHEAEYEIISAFHQGRIADYPCAQKILRFLLGKAGMKYFNFLKPAIAICIPADLNTVEKKAYEDAVYQCGAKAVYLCTEPFDHIIQYADQPLLKNVKYIIGITKDEPSAYIKEALSETIELAKQQGFDKDWVQEFLETYEA